MKSQKLGKNTSKAEVLNISPFGLWLLVLGVEYFLSYKEFPWFKEAKVSEIYNFELVHNTHLYWLKLDIDLSLQSLAQPEKFPLKFKA
jgi:hypothetical protein